MAVEHLEIYKLHSELADRVSQRRESSNRLYVSLTVGLVVFIASLFRFSAGGNPEEWLVASVSGTGILLSCVWWVNIRSYQQLNSAKFRVLHDLEKELAFAFFTQEWDPQSEGRRSNRYWRLTYVEAALPIIFALMFASLLGYSVGGT